LHGNPRALGTIFLADLGGREKGVAHGKGRITASAAVHPERGGHASCEGIKGRGLVKGNTGAKIQQLKPIRENWRRKKGEKKDFQKGRGQIPNEF